MSNVTDRRPIVHADTFVSEDFEAAVNCNRELHTGARKRKQVAERYKKACEKGEQITNVAERG